MNHAIQIVGRGGRLLSEQWGGSSVRPIIFHSECEMQFIGVCLARMLAEESRSIEVRADSDADYVRRLQEELAGTVWARPSVRHWW